MPEAISLTLSYEGNEADEHQIDLYDVSQALVGFQRSLALTTHLVLHGQIITQAPSLKGARILALPPEDGSWKMTATILTGVYALGTAPHDTPLGNLIYSAYDYVVSESLGVHVDYDRTLGELIEEHRREGNAENAANLEQHKVDSLMEKCTTALTEMHRPIFKTQSALNASVVAHLGERSLPVGPTLSFDTFNYIREEFTDDSLIVIRGRVSSYNSNTYKGRIYVAAEGRPVAFVLSENCRNNTVFGLVTDSLAANALRDYQRAGSTVYFRVFKNTTRSGHLKSYKVIEVSGAELE